MKDKTNTTDPAAAIWERVVQFDGKLSLEAFVRQRAGSRCEYCKNVGS